MNKARATDRIIAAHCQMNWLVFVNRFATDSEVELIKLQLPSRLAELEATGLDDFSCTDQLSYGTESVRKICDDLKLIRGSAITSAGKLPAIIIQYA